MLLFLIRDTPLGKNQTTAKIINGVKCSRLKKLKLPIRDTPLVKNQTAAKKTSGFLSQPVTNFAQQFGK